MYNLMQDECTDVTGELISRFDAIIVYMKVWMLNMTWIVNNYYMKICGIYHRMIANELANVNKIVNYN